MSDQPTPPGARDTVIWAAIRAEIAAQHYVHQNEAIGHPSTSGDRRMTILTEEVGEVAQEVLHDTDLEALRDELVQVAACAVAWLEAITCHCGGHALPGEWLRVHGSRGINYHGRKRCTWNVPASEGT